MRFRTFSLILPVLVLVAACASTTGSPSPAAPSAAAPSTAVSSPSPSASAAPSVAPSEAPASVDPGTAFNEETLQPVLTEITTAVTRWGEAAAAAAASDADDTDRIALQSAAFRVRVALQSGTAILTAAEPPECATAVRDDALSFIADLTSSSEDLLADDSVSETDVQAVIQQAADGSAPLAESLSTACA